MTTFQFLIYVGVAYLIYYIVIISYDLLLKSRGETGFSETLDFREKEEVQVIEGQTPVTPERKEVEKPQRKEEEPKISHPTLSGGVEMQDLIDLYKQNALSMAAQVFNK